MQLWPLFRHTGHDRSLYLALEPEVLQAVRKRTGAHSRAKQGQLELLPEPPKRTRGNPCPFVLPLMLVALRQEANHTRGPRVREAERVSRGRRGPLQARLWPVDSKVTQQISGHACEPQQGWTSCPPSKSPTSLLSSVLTGNKWGREFWDLWSGPAGGHIAKPLQPAWISFSDSCENWSVLIESQGTDDCSFFCWKLVEPGRFPKGFPFWPISPCPLFH